MKIRIPIFIFSIALFSLIGLSVSAQEADSSRYQGAVDTFRA
jgi:hypothetical protein